jgi:hypothetical protein
LQGNLTFTPQNFRFQPGYPGKRQEAVISIKNQYNSTVKLSGIISDKVDIIPMLLNTQIKPFEKIETFKLIFDPS